LAETKSAACSCFDGRESTIAAEPTARRAPSVRRLTSAIAREISDG
jgi:hypothetical protein